jgi:hypothetical protein
MLIHELLVISDNCPHLYKEMEGYAKDDKGNIPKINDHLIDAFRYALISWNYNMHEIIDGIKTRAIDADMREGRFRRRSDRRWNDDDDQWGVDIYDF